MLPYEYFQEIEAPCARIFQQMSNRGICVNLRYLDILKEQLEAQITPIKQEIYTELGGINLNSPKQLLEALNEKGIYPFFKGKPSTDKRALAYKSSEPIIEKLLAYSQIDTLLTSFVHPYLERNQSIIHCFFNQCGTRTGRLSCSNPNLLQIPKHTENGRIVRKMFVPRPNMVMGELDYGQIEPRVLAHLSKDAALCELFNSGTDFHDYTASRLGIDRTRAKVLNLSVGYRATFKSVSQQLKCSESEAQDETDKWWELFPVLRRWQESLIYTSKKSGFCTTLLGRRIKIDDLEHGNSWRREGAERQLINNITQGSAAELIKLVMIKLVKRQPLLGLLVQVYDSLLIESEEIDIDLIESKNCMETAFELDVPLSVSVAQGKSWGDCL